MKPRGIEVTLSADQEYIYIHTGINCNDCGGDHCLWDVEEEDETSP